MVYYLSFEADVKKVESVAGYAKYRFHSYDLIRGVALRPWQNQALRLKHPRKITLVASIVEQLVETIQNGTLKPGDKLPSERQLIQMLGVGRSSVREALAGFGDDGLGGSASGAWQLCQSKLA